MRSRTRSSPDRKSKSTWAAARFRWSARTAQQFFHWRRLGDRRLSFPQHPTRRPAPAFPVAPLAGTTRANDSVFPVAPLALGSNRLRPLDDPDALVAGDPLPGEGPEDLSGHDDDNPLPE